MRINEQIRLSPIRLIDHNNEQKGIVPTEQAMTMARELGMDLVEVSPTERPPVCRIMDYGKYKYELKKRQKQRQSHEVTIKELRLRPKTDVHDKQIKMKRALDFLAHGAKVQFTMLFRGRERFHQDMGYEVFKSIVDELATQAKVERPPKMEGRRMTMVLSPVKH